MTVAYIRKNKEPKKGLHWVWLVLIIFGVSGIISWAYGEKTYTLNDTANGWIKKYNGLEFIEQQIKYSDLPSKTTTLIIDSILHPFKDDIMKQIQPALQAEQKRVQDSVNKKNEKPKQ